MSGLDGVPPSRAELVAAAIEAGVTYHTAHTQVSAFLKWHREGMPKGGTPRGIHINPASGSNAHTTECLHQRGRPRPRQLPLLFGFLLSPSAQAAAV